MENEHPYYPVLPTAKAQVTDFARKTMQNPYYGMRFIGNMAEAERFVHRMRVELSRGRNLVRQRGHRPIPFKMLIIKCEHDGTGIDIVLCRKQKDGPVERAVDEIFTALDGGKVNV